MFKEFISLERHLSSVVLKAFLSNLFDEEIEIEPVIEGEAVHNNEASQRTVSCPSYVMKSNDHFTSEVAAGWDTGFLGLGLKSITCTGGLKISN